MINFLGELNSLMTSALSESFLLNNHKAKKDIIYPYLTYDHTITSDQTFSDEFTLNVDVFDNQGLSQLRIEATCWEIRRKLNRYISLIDDCLIRILFVRQHTIPTGSDTLQRRNMEFRIKVDWRNQCE